MTSHALEVAAGEPNLRSAAAFPRRPKVAFIHQPWSVVHPPDNGPDSITLLTDEIGRWLTSSCSVVSYSRWGKGQPRVQHFADVEYQHASVSIDRWIKLGMQALDRRGWRNPQRPFFSSPLCYRQFIGQVIEDLEKQACDIVHVQNFSQFVPLIRKRFPHVKIVLQMHCEWLNQLDFKQVQQRIEAADLVLGVSDFLAEKVRRRYPHLAHRCRHIYNGANIERFAFPAKNVTREEKRILYVSRMSPEKGVHILLDAFALVLKKHPDAKLDLIGPEDVCPVEMILPFCDDPLMQAMKEWYRPGAYSHLLREKIAALPAGSVNYLYKGLGHTELVPHYQAATVFAFPSIWEEPFGMPLVEAMAAGAPVIATQGGAFPEIVQDKASGLLVPRANADAFAAAILQMLENPQQRNEFEALGKSLALSRFGWGHIATDLLREYRGLYGS